MALLQKIKTISRRIVQLEGGTGNNQPARASDVNPIIDWINNRSDVNTVANIAASAGTNTAQTVTLNAISGTITTDAANTTTAGLATLAITVTNAYCTANSTILIQIAGGAYTNGVPMAVRAVPSAGSFVISIYNAASGVALNGSVTLKFIIL